MSPESSKLLPTSIHLMFLIMSKEWIKAYERKELFDQHTLSLLFSFIFNADIMCMVCMYGMVCMWRSKDNIGCGSPTTTFLVEEGSPSACQAWFAMRTERQAPKYIPVNSSYLTVVALK